MGISSFFSDVGDDIGSGFKTVTGAFGGITKNIMGMFTGGLGSIGGSLTMSIILPLLIPVIGIILLFKLL
jgi:hypothetical protein